MRPIPGDLTTLRPTGEDDLELLAGWFADPEVHRWWGGRPLTRGEVAEKYLGRRRPAVESYVVELGGEPVGYVQSHTGFEPYHPPGEGGIDLFVVPHARRRGVGRDAAHTLAAHLLHERGWRRVTADPAKSNPRALAFWRAAGFRPVGEVDGPDGAAELLELTAADVSRRSRGGDLPSVSVQDVNPPESPRIVAAEIVGDARTGAECLLARDEAGRELAFAFEVSSDAPGVSLVDPARLREVSASPEDDERRFEAVVEPRADEWLPSLVAHPVAAEWLARIEAEHPAAYRAWFEQTQYESGGEEGSG